MIFPKKYNPVSIEITSLTKSSKLIDQDFSDVVQKKYSETILTVDGQINYKRKDKQESTYTGDQDDSAGHIIITKKYWNDNSLNIKKGDLITKISGFPVRYKIIEVRPAIFLRRTHNAYMCRFIEDPRIKDSL